MGLIITAVFVPLTGLLAMLLFEGDYSVFFRRIGKIPGFLVAVSILGLIGPLGGIPRCVTISFSTIDAFHIPALRWLNLLAFSALSCVLLFLFTYKPRRILSLLGYVLTPLLLLSLAFIVGKGLWGMSTLEISSHTGWEAFSRGLLDGYNTLDLLAAFFFSSIVLLCLKKNYGEKSVGEKKSMLTVAMSGSILAAVLLTLVYICFTYLAAGHSAHLHAVASDQLLGTLACTILGSQAGLVASALVCFACFTTEIALTAIFAGFLQKTLLKEKISYATALILTLSAAFLVSSLHFSGISAFLVPIVQVCYPALIVLSLLNILYKLYGFKPVKTFFYGTIGLSLLVYLLT